MVCHVVVIETSGGLVMVDTGLSQEELEKPATLGPVGRGLGIHGEPQRAAICQLDALGHRPEDVTHIVMTHLDLDHAGGLRDFPGAEVHVCDVELAAAMRPRTMGEKLRYRPQQWAHAPKWRVHSIAPSIGNELVKIPLEGLPAELSLVPLFGHTRGHCGVSFNSGGLEHFHVGDTWYAASEDSPSTSLAYALFQRSVHVNARQALASRHRVRQHLEDHSSTLAYSSHDTAAFAEAAGLLTSSIRCPR